MSIKIAAIITSYNEEQRIGYTLDSLKKFDDVIVFDKGSKDNTANIVDSYNAKLYTIPFTDITTDEEYDRIFQKALKETECEWMMLLTCSDIVHPDLYERACQYINSNEVDVVEVPFYRYSMGFVSKYSYYKDLHYKDILLKKDVYINNSDIHVMSQYSKECKVGKMKNLSHEIAVYHLTHENLEMILERHLRYARIEACSFATREEGLYRTWRDILRQVYLFFKQKSYKLGEQGKAQLCMLLLYRTAKYLNVYFDKDKEAEIKKVYDSIRNNKTNLFIDSSSAFLGKER